MVNVGLAAAMCPVLRPVQTLPGHTSCPCRAAAPPPASRDLGKAAGRCPGGGSLVSCPWRPQLQTSLPGPSHCLLHTWSPLLASLSVCRPGSVPPPAQPRPARLSPRPPSRGRPACPLTSSAISAKASRRPYRPMTEVVWWYLQGRAGLVQRPWARPGQQPVHPRLSRARPSDHRAASVPGECSPLGILDSKMEGQLDLGDQGSERG